MELGQRGGGLNQVIGEAAEGSQAAPPGSELASSNAGQSGAGPLLAPQTLEQTLRGRFWLL